MYSTTEGLESDHELDYRDLIVQTLLWNRQSTKPATTPADSIGSTGRQPLIYSALVQLKNDNFTQHLQGLFRLKVRPFVFDMKPLPHGMTTGLALAGNAWTRIEWAEDGPAEWKDLDRWAEKAIELLTQVNQVAKFDPVVLCLHQEPDA
jgi:hypothetical protein